MPASILDSSLYITALPTGGAEISLRNIEREGAVWLRAVVVSELFAGTKGRKAIAAVEKLEQDFRKAKRFLVREAAHWLKSGRILTRLRDRFDSELRSKFRLVGDVLIAVSAGRIGATVVTTNGRDFARIAEFTPLTWRLQLP